MPDFEGITRQQEEVAVHAWWENRILTEKIIYDSATAWQVVKPQRPRFWIDLQAQKKAVRRTTVF